MWNERPRRPYEKKTYSKAGALIFGLGLGALCASVVILVGVVLPDVSSRFDNLSYYARTYYRKLVPHPEFLPTPAPTVSAAVSFSDRQVELNLPPAPHQSIAGNFIPLSDEVDNSQQPPVVVIEVTPPPSAQLTGFEHQWQTWNNCGPATISMYMSYYGHPQSQADAALSLKPNRDDKNVSPYELAAYARSFGLEAVVRQGGSMEQLKQFLSQGIPILAETWLIHDGDGLGHYRLVTGYDDATGEFNTFDSLNGPDYKVSYDQFDADWRVFNRLYIVVYSPVYADIARAVMGEDLNDTVMYERILAQAQREVEANPEDAIAHFNRGDALTRLGRYQEATEAFDRARQIGLHWRRLWYQFTPFEAYYRVARYQDVLDLTQATIKGTGGLEEAYYYHGLASHASGQPGAETDFQAALEYNPLFSPAADALNVLLEGG